MKKREIQLELEQLTDSRLLYMQKVPDFGFYILIVVLLLFCAAGIWSTKAHKVSIIKAQGVVESTNKNYVTPPFSGEITEYFMEEGMIVEEGDILFRIKSVDFNLQKDQLTGEKENYEKQIEQFRKLIDSIKDDKNYFSINEEEDSLYYNQYEAYKSRIEQNQLNLSMMADYGYTDEQIENEIIKNQNVVSEIYYSTLSEIEESILSCQKQIDSINVNLETIENGLSEYTVTANTSGTLHLLSEYKAGMVVQASALVASIASESDTYRIRANVAPGDFSRIDLNDRVEIEMSGLLPSIYGTISGRITAIDSDATVMENAEGGASSCFTVYIEPDTFYIISKAGKKVNLSSGMEAVINIQYDEATYFDYLMDSFGVQKR